MGNTCSEDDPHSQQIGVYGTQEISQMYQQNSQSKLTTQYASQQNGQRIVIQERNEKSLQGSQQQDKEYLFTQQDGLDRFKNTAEFGGFYKNQNIKGAHAYGDVGNYDDVQNEGIYKFNNYEYIQSNEGDIDSSVLAPSSQESIDDEARKQQVFMKCLIRLQSLYRGQKQRKYIEQIKKTGEPIQTQKELSNAPNSSFSHHGQMQINSILQKYLDREGYFKRNKLECQKNLRVQKIIADKDIVALPAYTFNQHKGIYQGEWKKGMRHGYGIFAMENQIYEGYWEDNYSSGYGRTIFINGDIYEGEYFKDTIQGYGIYRTREGVKYSGQWSQNKQNGFGREEWKDGSVFVGNFSMGQKQGQGRFEFGDGSIYQGTFLGNKFNGDGIYIWPNGNKYEGRWQDNQMNGKGQYTWPDGRMFQGNYVNGKREGRGQLIWPNKQIYDGLWKQGLQHGEGIYSDSKQTERHGAWNMGKFVQWLE